MSRKVVEEVKVKGPEGQKGVAILYDTGELFIEWVRFSYPHLDKPWKKEGDQGAPKYSLQAMLNKDTHGAAIDLVQDRIDAILKEHKVKKLKSDRIFMRDGDDSDDEAHEGYMTISAREEERPPLRNRAAKQVADEDVRRLFRPGYYGAVLLRPWWMDNKWGKRVNCGLSSVQFLGKGEEFGTGRLKEEDLDTIYRKYDDDDADEYEDDEDDKPARSKRRSRDDDDEDDDKPARSKRRSRDDDDEDERPARKRRSRDDDDDDEKPARRKRASRDDDDDEDERPARKRRSRDDDDDYI